jgi:hypothetical protein
MDKSLLASPEIENAKVDATPLSHNQSADEPMTPEGEKEHIFSSPTGEQVNSSYTKCPLSVKTRD